MQHLEGSGTPVLYIGRTILKGSARPYNCSCNDCTSRNPTIHQSIVTIRNISFLSSSGSHISFFVCVYVLHFSLFIVKFSNTQQPRNLQTRHHERLSFLTLRLLMSYIYGAPILDVSRSHTTTQHSR